jgi:hypothetical protein
VRSVGAFAEWQPSYAELELATFPVNGKQPAVRGYIKLGLAASKQLAIKFPTANAFGLACRKSNIAVLDIDAPDERLLADMMSEVGPSPFVVRSGSGNFQAWYRHSGERRRVRPNPDRPVDILGDGFVVAPPSRGSKGTYTIIQGTLDCLANLPEMRRPAAPPAIINGPIDLVPLGCRNDSLWRECMARARDCRTISDLMEVAVILNRTVLYEPLSDEEVIRIVASAWAKELAGENWFGRGGQVIVSAAEVDELLRQDPDAFVLLTVLRRHHWGRSFAIANAMADTMPGGGWRRQRFASARRNLEAWGLIEQLRAASKHQGPAVYKLKGGHK